MFNILFRNFEVIELLVQAGATLKQSKSDIANELCSLAKNNDLDGLTAWHVAGGNLGEINYDGRSALHIAVDEGHDEVTRFLVSQVESSRL